MHMHHRLWLPSTAVVKDPYFANVTLLAHMNGADASVVFTDSSASAKTITTFGDAQIDTAQSKFGGSSGLFDGTGDYLTVPDSSDWPNGTGEWTMECWIKLASTGNQAIINQSNVGAAASSAFILFIGSGGPGTGIYVTNGGGSWDKGASANITLDTAWHHVAAARTGDTLKFFWDGTEKASTALGAGYSINNCTRVLEIGQQAGSYLFVGSMDEVRITTGIARYTGNFTPPTAEFPNS